MRHFRIGEQHRVRLSPRECEVIELVRKGCSNKEIGYRLGISERTVKGHVSKLLGALRMENRTQVALWAVEHGLAVTGISIALDDEAA